MLIARFDGSSWTDFHRALPNAPPLSSSGSIETFDFGPEPHRAAHDPSYGRSIYSSTSCPICRHSTGVPGEFFPFVRYFGWDNVSTRLFRLRSMLAIPWSRVATAVALR